MSNEKSWFLYGPQGTGKSQLAPKLAKRLGLKSIVDPWKLGDPILSLNVLYVCQVPPPTVRTVMHVAFAERLTRTRGTS